MLSGDERAINQLKAAFGEQIVAALGDEMVTDILVNEDGNLWIERLGEEMCCVGVVSANNLLTAINALASFYGVVVDVKSPVFSCELPVELFGARVEANVSPVVRGPTMAIRKKVSRVLDLVDYVSAGGMTVEQVGLLRMLVEGKKNIIVCGSTGSGKTTLTNAVLNCCVEVFPNDRFYIVEDLSELQCSAENITCKCATEYCDIDKLLRSALRQRPDVIVIGEVRGHEAWTLLKSWNTGHPGGVCTLHADVVSGGQLGHVMALRRLEQLCLEHPYVPGLEVLREVIGDVVGGVVTIFRDGVGVRKVSSVVEVVGYDLSNLEYRFGGVENG